MGFQKQVEPVPPPVPTYYAFQYDGTQQSIDDLNAVFPTNNFDVQRIDATQWRYSPMGPGSERNVGLDEVVVFTLYPSIDGHGSATYPPFATVTEFEAVWQDA